MRVVWPVFLIKMLIYGYAYVIIISIGGETMENIKQLRENKGYTQMDLAVKVGVSLTSVRMWEKGVSTPKPENKDKLEKVLDIKG